MSTRSFFARLTTKVVAVAVLSWVGSTASAADIYAPPPVAGAAPVMVGAPGCETCQHGAVKAHCATCGKFLSLSQYKHSKGPYPVNLCPGACFGYFQTQWRKWDDVCPYPYLGHGVSDAPKPPIPAVNLPRPSGGGLTPPRPLDPKMADPKKSGELPPIPPVPGKFIP